jgi:hypothetical protein
MLDPVRSWYKIGRGLGDQFVSQTTPTITMGVIADTFAAMLEELKQRDDELNRDIQDTLKRCDVLLDKLTKLDNE